MDPQCKVRNLLTHTLVILECFLQDLSVDVQPPSGVMALESCCLEHTVLRLASRDESEREPPAPCD
jgi:hypothetical protein